MTLPIGRQTVTGLMVSYGSNDSLGVPAKTVTEVTMTGVSFQPATTTETLGDTDQVTSHWVLYAPADVNLTALDSIVTPWDGLQYDVDGDPQVWTDIFGRVSHQEVNLRKATG